MLETAAAGETLLVVGAGGRGEMRRWRALYAMAEVEEDESRHCWKGATCCLDLGVVW